MDKRKDSAYVEGVKAFSVMADALRHCQACMDWDSFDRAVKLLAKAPRIAASGCGHSGIVCRDFAHLMNCIERPACFLPPGEASHGGSGFLQPGDVMVLASRGGRTQELIPLLKICKAKGVKVISITENLSSPLAAGADVVLPMAVTRECDPNNCQGTTSTVVLTAIFVALQTALIEETGHTMEQFAVVHPGGAVGERIYGR